MSKPDPNMLQDAEPEAWRGEKRPGPSAEEAAVILAAKRFAKLDDDLLNYTGARTGHGYEALLAEWRTARTALVGLARAMPGEQR